jgi:hypothetical protein
MVPLILEITKLNQQFHVSSESKFNAISSEYLIFMSSHERVLILFTLKYSSEFDV